MPENPDYTFFLISRQLTGEATAAERDALQKWLAEDPGNQQQYELLKQFWQAKANLPIRPVESKKINRIFQLAAFEEALQEDPEWTPDAQLKKKGSRTWKIAAGLIALAFISWAIMHWTTNRNTVQGNLVIAQKGSRTRTILPDGSTVWLNGGSSLSYDRSFNEKAREVTLSGEACFDITKQSGSPFTVNAGMIQLNVLGTAFNVKAYADDNTTEITVMEGLVRLTRTGRKESLFLRADQKIILAANGKGTADAATRNLEEKLITIDTALKENERPETAWIYNRLEFRDEDFRSLARKMERWYNITVHFEDEKVKDLVFSGSIENESVEQAFKALKAAVPFSYSVKANAVFIRSL